MRTVDAPRTIHILYLLHRVWDDEADFRHLTNQYAEKAVKLQNIHLINTVLGKMHKRRKDRPIAMELMRNGLQA